MIVESKTIIPNPVVSVGVITYNHEEYLRECLDHIMSQQCDFEYEIVIAEDKSTDKTREICKEYQQKYPDKVRLLLQDTNQGMMRNYGDMLKMCRGRYIAICSGDDYWCDDTKLQKQYDCLENNPDYGVVRTLGYHLKNGQLEASSGNHPDVEGDVKEYAIWGALGFASSIFFKASLLQYFSMDECIRRGITMEDYPMNAIFAHHTQFALIRDRMIVYRILPNSVSKNKQVVKQAKFTIGYWAVRQYLKELYPSEVPWTQEEIDDAQNYQRLKICYVQNDFEGARKLDFKTKKYRRKNLVRFRKLRLAFALIHMRVHQ